MAALTVTAWTPRPPSRGGRHEEVGFADRVASRAARIGALARSARVSASGFLAWLSRDNLLGASARLWPQWGSAVVQAVGWWAALNSELETD